METTVLFNIHIQFIPDNYVYVEASYPALYGYRAVLISPTGLAGCFCFRYSYHMFTDENVEFFCTINDKKMEGQHKDCLLRDQQGVTPMNNTKRSKWIRTWLSVNEPGNVTVSLLSNITIPIASMQPKFKTFYFNCIQIQITVIRGSTFRGDVALDHFVLTPGKCDEDIL